MFHKFIPTEPPKRERSSSGEGSPPKNRPRREQTAEELAELVRQSSLSRQSSLRDPSSSASPMGSATLRTIVNYLLRISQNPDDEVKSTITQYLHVIIARIQAGEITRADAVEIGLGKVIRRIRSSQVGPAILSLITGMMEKLRELSPQAVVVPVPPLTAPTKSVNDRLIDLKKYRKKEHKILSALFDDLDDLYKQVHDKKKILFDGFDKKARQQGSKKKAADLLKAKAVNKSARGKSSTFQRVFGDQFEKLAELTGPDGITYREAYRGPVKRSWHVTGKQISSVSDLDDWNGEPVYIMWERRAPRQSSAVDKGSAAGGKKNKSNYNDYDEEGRPHLTWELPSAATDIMSTNAGRRALFPMGRLVIVIEKFKGTNPADRSVTITQHRIKGIYVVLKTPMSGDVKLCLYESQDFIERFTVGEIGVPDVWFFQQNVSETEEVTTSSSSSE